jgi:hypothetical protein
VELEGVVPRATQVDSNAAAAAAAAVALRPDTPPNGEEVCNAAEEGRELQAETPSEAGAPSVWASSDAEGGEEEEGMEEVLPASERVPCRLQKGAVPTQHKKVERRVKAKRAHFKPKRRGVGGKLPPKGGSSENTSRLRSLDTEHANFIANDYHPVDGIDDTAQGGYHKRKKMVATTRVPRATPSAHTTTPATPRASMTSSGRSVKAPDRMKVVHAPSSKRKRRQATVPESDDDAPESDDDAPDGAGGAGGAGGKAAKPPRKKAARPAKESDFPEIGAALAASKKLEEDRVLLQDVQAVVRRADLPGKPGMLPEPRARYIDETTGESYSIQGNSESRALLRDNDSHAWEKTNAEHHRKAANTGEKYCPQRDPDNIVSKEQAAAATCIICAYVLDGDYTELDCSHAFCRGCIKTWTTTGKRKTCPVCRSHLDRRNLKQSGFFTGLINKLSCVCPHGPPRKLRDKSPVAAAAAAAAASSSSATVVVAARVSSDKTEDGAPLTEQVSTQPATALDRQPQPPSSLAA